MAFAAGAGAPSINGHVESIGVSNVEKGVISGEECQPQPGSLFCPYTQSGNNFIKCADKDATNNRQGSTGGGMKGSNVLSAVAQGVQGDGYNGTTSKPHSTWGGRIFERLYTNAVAPFLQSSEVITASQLKRKLQQLQMSCVPPSLVDPDGADSNYVQLVRSSRTSNLDGVNEERAEMPSRIESAAQNKVDFDMYTLRLEEEQDRVNAQLVQALAVEEQTFAKIMQYRDAFVNFLSVPTRQQGLTQMELLTFAREHFCGWEHLSSDIDQFSQLHNLDQCMCFSLAYDAVEILGEQRRDTSASGVSVSEAGEIIWDPHMILCALRREQHFYLRCLLELALKLFSDHTIGVYGDVEQQSNRVAVLVFADLARHGFVERLIDRIGTLITSILCPSISSSMPPPSPPPDSLLKITLGLNSDAFTSAFLDIHTAASTAYSEIYNVHLLHSCVKLLHLYFARFQASIREIDALLSLIPHVISPHALPIAGSCGRRAVGAHEYDSKFQQERAVATGDSGAASAAAFQDGSNRLQPGTDYLIATISAMCFSGVSLSIRLSELLLLALHPKLLRWSVHAGSGQSAAAGRTTAAGEPLTGNSSAAVEQEMRWRTRGHWPGLGNLNEYPALTELNAMSAVKDLEGCKNAKTAEEQAGEEIPWDAGVFYRRLVELLRTGNDFWRENGALEALLRFVVCGVYMKNHQLAWQTLKNSPVLCMLYIMFLSAARSAADAVGLLSLQLLHELISLAFVGTSSSNNSSNENSSGNEEQSDNAAAAADESSRSDSGGGTALWAHLVEVELVEARRKFFAEMTGESCSDEIHSSCCSRRHRLWSVPPAAGSRAASSWPGETRRRGGGRSLRDAVAVCCRDYCSCYGATSLLEQLVSLIAAVCQGYPVASALYVGLLTHTFERFSALFVPPLKGSFATLQSGDFAGTSAAAAEFGKRGLAIAATSAEETGCFVPRRSLGAEYSPSPFVHYGFPAARGGLGADGFGYSTGRERALHSFSQLQPQQQQLDSTSGLGWFVSNSRNSSHTGLFQSSPAVAHRLAPFAAAAAADVLPSTTALQQQRVLQRPSPRMVMRAAARVVGVNLEFQPSVLISLLECAAVLSSVGGPQVTRRVARSFKVSSAAAVDSRGSPFTDSGTAAAVDQRAPIHLAKLLLVLVEQLDAAVTGQYAALPSECALVAADYAGTMNTAAASSGEEAVDAFRSISGSGMIVPQWMIGGAAVAANVGDNDPDALSYMQFMDAGGAYPRHMLLALEACLRLAGSLCSSFLLIVLPLPFPGISERFSISSTISTGSNSNTLKAFQQSKIFPPLETVSVFDIEGSNSWPQLSEDAAAALLKKANSPQNRAGSVHSTTHLLDLLYRLLFLRSNTNEVVNLSGIKAACLEALSGNLVRNSATALAVLVQLGRLVDTLRLDIVLARRHDQQRMQQQQQQQKQHQQQQTSDSLQYKGEFDAGRLLIAFATCAAYNLQLVGLRRRFDASLAVFWERLEGTRFTQRVNFDAAAAPRDAAACAVPATGSLFALSEKMAGAAAESEGARYREAEQTAAACRRSAEQDNNFARMTKTEQVVETSILRLTVFLLKLFLQLYGQSEMEDVWSWLPETRYWKLATLLLRCFRCLCRGPLPRVGMLRVDTAAREPFRDRLRASAAATTFLMRSFLCLESGPFDALLKIACYHHALVSIGVNPVNNVASAALAEASGYKDSAVSPSAAQQQQYLGVAASFKARMPRFSRMDIATAAISSGAAAARLFYAEQASIIALDLLRILFQRDVLFLQLYRRRATQQLRSSSDAVTAAIGRRSAMQPRFAQAEQQQQQQLKQSSNSSGRAVVATTPAVDQGVWESWQCEEEAAAPECLRLCYTHEQLARPASSLVRELIARQSGGALQKNAGDFPISSAKNAVEKYADEALLRVSNSSGVAAAPILVPPFTLFVLSHLENCNTSSSRLGRWKQQQKLSFFVLHQMCVRDPFGVAAIFRSYPETLRNIRYSLVTALVGAGPDSCGDAEAAAAVVAAQQLSNEVQEGQDQDASEMILLDTEKYLQYRKSCAAAIADDEPGDRSHSDNFTSGAADVFLLPSTEELADPLYSPLLSSFFLDSPTQRQRNRLKEALLQQQLAELFFPEKGFQQLQSSSCSGLPAATSAAACMNGLLVAAQSFRESLEESLSKQLRRRESLVQEGVFTLGRKLGNQWTRDNNMATTGKGDETSGSLLTFEGENVQSILHPESAATAAAAAERAAASVERLLIATALRGGDRNYEELVVDAAEAVTAAATARAAQSTTAWGGQLEEADEETVARQLFDSSSRRLLYSEIKVVDEGAACMYHFTQTIDENEEAGERETEAAIAASARLPGVAVSCYTALPIHRALDGKWQRVEDALIEGTDMATWQALRLQDKLEVAATASAAAASAAAAEASVSTAAAASAAAVSRPKGGVGDMRGRTDNLDNTGREISQEVATSRGSPYFTVEDCEDELLSFTSLSSWPRTLEPLHLWVENAYLAAYTEQPPPSLWLLPPFAPPVGKVFETTAAAYLTESSSTQTVPFGYDVVPASYHCSSFHKASLRRMALLLLHTGVFTACRTAGSAVATNTAATAAAAAAAVADSAGAFCALGCTDDACLPVSFVLLGLELPATRSRGSFQGSSSSGEFAAAVDRRSGSATMRLDIDSTDGMNNSETMGGEVLRSLYPIPDIPLQWAAEEEQQLTLGSSVAAALMARIIATSSCTVADSEFNNNGSFSQNWSDQYDWEKSRVFTGVYEQQWELVLCLQIFQTLAAHERTRAAVLQLIDAQWTSRYSFLEQMLTTNFQETPVILRPLMLLQLAAATQLCAVELQTAARTAMKSRAEVAVSNVAIQDGREDDKTRGSTRTGDKGCDRRNVCYAGEAGNDRVILRRSLTGSRHSRKAGSTGLEAAASESCLEEVQQQRRRQGLSDASEEGFYAKYERLTRFLQLASSLIDTTRQTCERDLFSCLKNIVLFFGDSDSDEKKQSVYNVLGKAIALSVIGAHEGSGTARLEETQEENGGEYAAITRVRLFLQLKVLQEIENLSSELCCIENEATSAAARRTPSCTLLFNPLHFLKLKSQFLDPLLERRARSLSNRRGEFTTEVCGLIPLFLLTTAKPMVASSIDASSPLCPSDIFACGDVLSTIFYAFWLHAFRFNLHSFTAAAFHCVLQLFPTLLNACYEMLSLLMPGPSSISQLSSANFLCSTASTPMYPHLSDAAAAVAAPVAMDPFHRLELAQRSLELMQRYMMPPLRLLREPQQQRGISRQQQQRTLLEITRVFHSTLEVWIADVTAVCTLALPLPVLNSRLPRAFPSSLALTIAELLLFLKEEGAVFSSQRTENKDRIGQLLEESRSSTDYTVTVAVAADDMCEASIRLLLYDSLNLLFRLRCFPSASVAGAAAQGSSLFVEERKESSIANNLLTSLAVADGRGLKQSKLIQLLINDAEKHSWWSGHFFALSHKEPHSFTRSTREELVGTSQFLKEFESHSLPRELLPLLEGGLIRKLYTLENCSSKSRENGRSNSIPMLEHGLVGTFYKLRSPAFQSLYESKESASVAAAAYLVSKRAAIAAVGAAAAAVAAAADRLALAALRVLSCIFELLLPEQSLALEEENEDVSISKTQCSDGEAGTGSSRNVFAAEVDTEYSDSANQANKLEIVRPSQATRGLRKAVETLSTLVAVHLHSLEQIYDSNIKRSSSISGCFSARHMQLAIAALGFLRITCNSSPRLSRAFITWRTRLPHFEKLFNHGENNEENITFPSANLFPRGVDLLLGSPVLSASLSYVRLGRYLYSPFPFPSVSSSLPLLSYIIDMKVQVAPIELFFNFTVLLQTFLRLSPLPALFVEQTLQWANQNSDFFLFPLLVLARISSACGCRYQQQSVPCVSALTEAIKRTSLLKNSKAFHMASQKELEHVAAVRENTNNLHTAACNILRIYRSLLRAKISKWRRWNIADSSAGGSAGIFFLLRTEVYFSENLEDFMIDWLFLLLCDKPTSLYTLQRKIHYSRTPSLVDTTVSLVQQRGGVCQQRGNIFTAEAATGAEYLICDGLNDVNSSGSDAEGQDVETRHVQFENQSLKGIPNQTSIDVQVSQRREMMHLLPKKDETRWDAVLLILEILGFSIGFDDQHEQFQRKAVTPPESPFEEKKRQAAMKYTDLAAEVLLRCIRIFSRAVLLKKCTNVQLRQRLQRLINAPAFPLLLSALEAALVLLHSCSIILLRPQHDKCTQYAKCQRSLRRPFFFTHLQPQHASESGNKAITLKKLAAVHPRFVELPPVLEKLRYICVLTGEIGLSENPLRVMAFFAGRLQEMLFSFLELNAKASQPGKLP